MSHTWMIAIGLFVVIGFVLILAAGQPLLGPLVKGFILTSILIVLLNNAGYLQKSENNAFNSLGGK